MTLVDLIDFGDEEYCVKVDEVVDLSSDEDSVEDGHVEEDDNVAQPKKAAEAAASLSISEHDATATTSLSKLEQEQGTTTSLSMVERRPPTSSLMADEAKQPEFQEILVASDGAEEATQFGNHKLTAVANCVGEAMQNIVEASDFELRPEVSQDIVIVPPSAQDKEKQVNTSAAECSKQLSILHTKEVQPIVHDSGFSVMGNTGNGEVVMCKYQGCSKPSQGNTMHCEVHSGGSEGCMVQGCTKGALEDTPLCISHHSRLRKVCCAETGCTNIACTSSGGRTDRCLKHGGGKRCKYDGCRKGAQGKTDFCIGHGGGRRCKFEGCPKSAPWRSDYCLEHGGGCCKFQGCSVGATCRTDFCSMHRKILLSGNYTAHEMQPTPLPKCLAKKARRNSCPVIGGGAPKRQNTNCYVDNTKSFNAFEMGEESRRVSVCEDNMLKAQQTTRETNSDQDGSTVAGSPPLLVLPLRWRN